MNNKNKKVTVRFNESEHEKIYSAAIQQDLSISEYIRSCLLYDNNKNSTHITGEASSDQTNVNSHDEAKYSLIQLTALIEEQSDNNKDKAKMKGLAEKIWQSLR